LVCPKGKRGFRDRRKFILSFLVERAVSILTRVMRRRGGKQPEDKKKKLQPSKKG